MNQPPDTEFTSRAVGFASGLLGTIGVRIKDSNEIDIVPRHTTDIIEDSDDPTSYIATLTSPTDPGQYIIGWDNGSGLFAWEDLIVSGGFITDEILPGEILATLADINTYLPSDDEVPTVVATSDNTALLQVGVARTIRAYLSRTLDNAILVGWLTPDVTPDIIREIAGRLIASQLYFNKNSEQSLTIEENSFAQKRYDEAIELLNQIILGSIIIPDVSETPDDSLELLDGFPIDDTDRAFTMSMEL